MAWCEANGVHFLFGLQQNPRLVAEIKSELAQAETKSRRTGKPARSFKEFKFKTRRSWSRERRVVGKAEFTKDEANPRFVVTSLERGECKPRYLYEKLYCARGEMENRIKECQLDLYADRTSTATMRANQLRLWLASFAYILLCAVRRIGLHHTPFAKASCGTIRLKLLKIGALVRVTDSGAGCGEHWPTCHGELVHIPRTGSTAIEFTHRVTSGLALVAVVALYVVTLRRTALGHPARRLALGAVGFIVLEALIGAGLVLFGLVEKDASVARAVTMPMHLVVTFAFTAILTVLAVWRDPPPADKSGSAGQQSALQCDQHFGLVAPIVRRLFSEAGARKKWRASRAAGSQHRVPRDHRAIVPPRPLRFILLRLGVLRVLGG